MVVTGVGTTSCHLDCSSVARVDPRYIAPALSSALALALTCPKPRGSAVPGMEVRDTEMSRARDGVVVQPADVCTRAVEMVASFLLEA